MTPQELEAKFRQNASLLIPMERTEEIIKAVVGMAASGRLDPLMTILRS